MRGMYVPRRFGWDCHGLPAEMKAEQDLGLGSKAEIENYGVEKFVEYCRTSVQQFTDEWQHYINRIGRWVDFKDNYYTMDARLHGKRHVGLQTALRQRFGGPRL